MVWRTMGKAKIIGLYFFRQSPVDSTEFKAMLRNCGLNKVQQLLVLLIFQQDSAHSETGA